MYNLSKFSLFSLLCIYMSTAAMNSELHEAVRDNNVGRVQALLLSGADVNARDNSGHTPLHRAAMSFHDYQAIVRLLLDHQADVNARCYSGRTPLHDAADMGHLEIVQLLLARGSGINARANNGRTPLHLAAHLGHLEIVQWLLDHGANVNARNNEGETALHCAAMMTQGAVVQLIKDHIVRQARQETLALLAASHPRTGSQSLVNQIAHNTYFFRDIFNVLKQY